MEEDLKSQFNIAVIDDSDYARKSISQIIEDAGYNVAAEASNAKKAMEIASANNIHLWVIDVVMPEMSGIEFIKNLTENFPTKQKLIIMMSSLNTETIIIDAISNGANDFLKKPFEADQLVQSVHKMFEIAQSEKML